MKCKVTRLWDWQSKLTVNQNYEIKSRNYEIEHWIDMKKQLRDENWLNWN